MRTRVKESDWIIIKNGNHRKRKKEKSEKLKIVRDMERNTIRENKNEVLRERKDDRFEGKWGRNYKENE